MRKMDDIVDKFYDVVIIGGGATGAGILRDISMRGLKAILLEKDDLAHGTTSRFHGLLHSGARYVVSDPASAEECAIENSIIRSIGKHIIEPIGGLFVRTKDDDINFEDKWREGCENAGVPFKQITIGEARNLEPGLTGSIVSAYQVEDAAVDGFRLVWQNVLSAKHFGADFRNYTEVLKIESKEGKVTGVKVRDTETLEETTIPCACVVNAAGSWANIIANRAGLSISIMPDKGSILAYNHRFCHHIVNRLRKPSNGDIFVPHGSVTLFGTTSSSAENPEDNIPSKDEAKYLASMAKEIFPEISSHRVLRAFAGTRPLFFESGVTDSRLATRNFKMIDHSSEGLEGFISIFGGKLTTYRLMAEKASDLVCKKFFLGKKCETANQPLLKDISGDQRERGKKIFPAAGLDLAYERLGVMFDSALEIGESSGYKHELLCECEFVTAAEYKAIAKEDSSVMLADIRRRTRMGMGTCQGSFCGLRGVSMLYDSGLNMGRLPADILLPFVEGRWKGLKPAMWGLQMPEAELMRSIYSTSLNISGGQPE